MVPVSGFQVFNVRPSRVHLMNAVLCPLKVGVEGLSAAIRYGSTTGALPVLGSTEDHVYYYYAIAGVVQDRSVRPSRVPTAVVCA